MAALRNLVGKIRIPGAFALRSSRYQAPAPSSLAKSEIEKALLAKNNIESVEAADLRSHGDLLAKHTDKTVQAISQVVEKQEVVGEKFCSLGYKYFGTAIVLGCINRMLDHYWKDKTDPDLEFLVVLKFPK